MKGLARKMAGDEGRPGRERWRRMLFRYLAGQNPKPVTRHLIEDALGVPRDSLEADEEDELSRLLLAAYRARQRELEVVA